MLGTLSEEEKSDWKSYLGCMTHAYNCAKHASTTYSPYYLMFGRHLRLPIDVEFGLPKTNSGDNSSKSRYVQKLRRRLNYAFQKVNKFANQQAQKYKSSYDKSMKGPQLQEKDIVLVKIVARKGRHKLQYKWEPEEYVVVEQPIARTPVYRVQPVTGGNNRTLHRILLLPLGVKLEPGYNSDDSILEENDSSSNESTILVDSKAKIYGKKKSANKSQPQSKREKHVEFDSNVDISPDSDLKSGFSDSDVVQESVGRESYISSEYSGDKVLPEDVSLPFQFLLPNLDDSSSDEETRITELNTTTTTSLYPAYEYRRHNTKHAPEFDPDIDSGPSTKEHREIQGSDNPIQHLVGETKKSKAPALPQHVQEEVDWPDTVPAKIPLQSAQDNDYNISVASTWPKTNYSEIPQLESDIDKEEEGQFEDIQTYLDHHNTYQESQNICKEYTKRLLDLDDERYYRDIDCMYKTYTQDQAHIPAIQTPAPHRMMQELIQTYSRGRGEAHREELYRHRPFGRCT